ncbi:MAG: tetratricopeptide repeat protein [Candidatus Acidiferrales bacterium]
MFAPVKRVWAQRITLLCASFGSLLALILAFPGTTYAQTYPGQAGQGQSGQRGATAVVVVTVVGEDGGPTGAGAEVTLSSEGDNGRTDMAGSDGMVRFVGIGRGYYTIKAHELGYDDGFGNVDVATSYGTFTATVSLRSLASPDTEGKGMVLAPKAREELDKGVEAMRRHQYDEARTHLDAAYKLAPGNPEVNDRLGEFFLVTKDIEKAQDSLQNALSLDPDNVNTLTDLGELRIVQGNYPAAQKSLDQAVNLNQHAWFAHWMLGVVYLRVNENEKARVEATSAIKEGKGSADDAQFVLGEALAKLGRTDEAIRALQMFIKGSPKNSYAPAATAMIAKLESGETPIVPDDAPRATQTAAPSSP